MKKLQSALIGAVLLGASAAVSAFPCATGYVNGGSGNFACVDGPTGNSNDANTIDQNNLTLFGFNDWTLLSKQDTGSNASNGALSQPVDIDLAVTGTLTSGTWAFNPNTWSSYGSILIVLKDGKFTPPEDGIYWSAYLVGPDQYSSGNWSMGDFRPRELSHLTVYGRGEGNKIPEPGTLALLGLAFVGAAWRMRRG